MRVRPRSENVAISHRPIALGCLNQGADSMRRVTLVAVFLVALAAPVRADVDAGVDAWEAGAHEHPFSPERP